MQTGQPGPMITSSSRGNVARKPKRAIACSWLPHTCMIDTGARPIAAVACFNAATSAAARSGSRNFSSLMPPSRVAIAVSGTVDLSAHVRRHQVLPFGFEEFLVQRERLLDVVFRD